MKSKTKSIAEFYFPAPKKPCLEGASSPLQASSGLKEAANPEGGGAPPGGPLLPPDGASGQPSMPKGSPPRPPPRSPPSALPSPPAPPAPLPRPPAADPAAAKEAADKAHIAMVLAKYNKEFEALKAVKQAKADMVASKRVQLQHPVAKVHGHIPGVPVGTVLVGKAELAVTGVHLPIVAGIDFTNGDQLGARCICMSGGYEDDDDQGDTFIYTGQGGQQKKKQVTDQKWEKGNLALQVSCRTGTPVRVVRGFPCETKGIPKYVYEGLYRVVDCWMEPSLEGPKITRFRFERIKEESKVPHRKVIYKCMSRGKTSNKQLGKDGKRKDGRTLHKFWSEAERLSVEEARLTKNRARDGYLMDDISGSKEAVRIPVFNEVDKVKPPAFEYLKASVVVSEGAKQVMARGAEGGGHIQCGLLAMGGQDSYNPDDCLLSTQPEGVYECPAGCAGPGRGSAMHRCDRQRVVQRGVVRPLEVFRTADRGWGVRCAEEIWEGAFVAEYTGEIISDREAEQLRGSAEGEVYGGMSRDAFLFDVDHFATAVRKGSFEGEGGAEEGDGEDEEGHKEIPGTGDRPLCCDALYKGSVARFFNHSCEGNMLIQPVLIPGDSRAFYRICLFASRDIAPGEELTYDYGYCTGSVAGRSMQCRCNAPTCRGDLL